MAHLRRKLPWFLAGALSALLLVYAADVTQGIAGRGPVGSPLTAEDVRPAVWQTNGPPTAGTLPVGDVGAAGGAASVLPAVVRVYGPSTAGSGVVISADGLVLTNAHVVGGAGDALMVVAGRSFTATVLHADERRDLALLRLPAGAYAFAPLGTRADAPPGSPVTVAGYPLDLEGAASLTSGIVSRYVSEPRNDRDLLQTDAEINLGNSGGPVVNADGLVVGIVTSFLGEHDALPARGIGFAVAVDSIREWLAECEAKAGTRTHARTAGRRPR